MTLGSLSLFRVLEGLGNTDLLHSYAFMVSVIILGFYVISIWLGIQKDRRKPKVNLQRPRTIPSSTNRQHIPHGFQELQDSSFIFQEESKRPD